MPQGRQPSQSGPSFSSEHRTMIGSVALERVGRWCFPVYELAVEETRWHVWVVSANGGS